MYFILWILLSIIIVMWIELILYYLSKQKIKEVQSYFKGYIRCMELMKAIWNWEQREFIDEITIWDIKEIVWKKKFKQIYSETLDFEWIKLTADKVAESYQENPKKEKEEAIRQIIDMLKD